MPQNRTPHVALSALSVDLATGSATATAPTAFRVLPYGRFKAADGSGRPKEVPDGWQLDYPAAALIAAAFNARRDAGVIDYEHQTLHATENGKPAPAAGWIGRLEAREEGLYAADVEWTEAAAALISQRPPAYRYISPVFSYDTRDGRVLAIAHAALTNAAGLDGLTDFAHLTALLSPPETTEDQPKMKELLKALGLPETATEAEALTALAALRATAPDPAKFIGISTLTAVQGELAAARTELAALKAASLDVDVAAAVAQGEQDGKITPATRAHMIDLGKKDLAALKSLIAVLPVVAKPGETQSGGTAPAQTSGPLTDVQLAVCRQLGVSEADYVKQLTPA
jgi:phage I-like protein